MLQFWVAMESVQLITSLTAAVACIWGSAIGCHGVCSCCYSNDDSHRVCYLICLHVSMLRVAFLVLSLPRWLVKSVKCPPICPSVRAGPGQHFPNPNAPRRLGRGWWNLAFFGGSIIDGQNFQEAEFWISAPAPCGRDDSPRAGWLFFYRLYFSSALERIDNDSNLAFRERSKVTFA